MAERLGRLWPKSGDDLTSHTCCKFDPPNTKRGEQSVLPVMELNDLVAAICPRCQLVVPQFLEIGRRYLAARGQGVLEIFNHDQRCRENCRVSRSCRQQARGLYEADDRQIRRLEWHGGWW